MLDGALFIKANSLPSLVIAEALIVLLAVRNISPIKTSTAKAIATPYKFISIAEIISFTTNNKTGNPIKYTRCEIKVDVFRRFIIISFLTNAKNVFLLGLFV